MGVKEAGNCAPMSDVSAIEKNCVGPKIPGRISGLKFRYNCNWNDLIRTWWFPDSRQNPPDRREIEKPSTTKKSHL